MHTGGVEIVTFEQNAPHVLLCAICQVNILNTGLQNHKRTPKTCTRAWQELFYAPKNRDWPDFLCFIPSKNYNLCFTLSTHCILMVVYDLNLIWPRLQAPQTCRSHQVRSKSRGLKGEDTRNREDGQIKIKLVKWSYLFGALVIPALSFLPLQRNISGLPFLYLWRLDPDPMNQITTLNEILMITYS